MKNRSYERGLLVLFLFFALVSCTKKEPPKQMTDAELVQRGKAIYMSNCTACHNVEPSKDGSVGPAIKGSSEQLVEARVMRAEYPAGYTPKRQTKIMVALPGLKNEIPAIAKFLNSDEAK